MRSSRSAAARVLAIATTISLSACAQQEQGAPAGGTEVRVALAQESDGNEVPIGVLLPLTGSWSWIGRAQNGVHLAIKEINEDGGIRTRDGVRHKVRAFVEDTASESRGAIAGAQKLYGVHNVVALIGPTSKTLISMLPLTKEAGAVQVSPTAGTTALDAIGGCIDGECVFRTVASDVVMGSGMVWYAKENLKAKRAAFFFADDEGARSIFGVTRDAAEVLGLENVGEVFFPAGQTSYRAELQSAFAKKPDVVFFEAGPETAAVFFKQWYELGLEGKWIGTDFVNDDLVAATTPASEGVMTVNPGALPSKRYDAWLAHYKAFTGRPKLDGFAANAYDAMNIVALALESSGETSREGVRRAIREVAGPPGKSCEDFPSCAALLRTGTEIDYDGLAGPQDFNEFGDPITYLKVEKIEDGGIVRLGTITDKEIGSVIGSLLAKRAATSDAHVAKSP